MGFFDTFVNNVKEVADSAKKTAVQALEDASSKSKELTKEASAAGSDLIGKVSEGFSSLSESVSTSAKDLSTWAEGMPDKLRKMADDFDADAMWDKLSETAVKAGQDLIVMVLTIYYSIESRITGSHNSGSNGKSK